MMEKPDSISDEDWQMVMPFVDMRTQRDRYKSLFEQAVVALKDSAATSAESRRLRNYLLRQREAETEDEGVRSK